MIAMPKTTWMAILLGTLFTFGCVTPNTFTVPDTQKRIGNLGFTVGIPIPGGPIRAGFPGNGIVNYDFYLNSKDFKPATLFSVEWISRKDKPSLSDKEVYEYLGTFIPEYLTKNFLNGKYSVIFYKPTRLNGQFPAVTVVGSGGHNGGSPGSIYLVAAYVDHHWVMIYSLNSNIVTSSDTSVSSLETLASLPAFEKFSKFVNSFELDLLNNERK